MPLVRIEMIKGRSPEYKKAVLECIHESLVRSLGIADWDRFQRIVEIEREDFETPPEKTDHFMIIEITMFPGRTKEMKRQLIEDMASSISGRLQIQPTDIFIVIHEPPDENWGLGGRQRGADS